MSVAQNIKQLRRIFHITQRELAEIAGVTENAVSKWENGYSIPRMGAIERIAACYGLTKFHIIEDGGMNFVDPETKTVTTPDPLAEAHAPEPLMKPVPLLGSVHAGPITELEEMADTCDSVLVPSFLLASDPKCYACVSEGDCMNRVYPADCIVIVSPQAEPVNGSVAVVSIEGLGTVMRRIYRTSQTLVLSPDSTNPSHEDIVITAHDGRNVTFGGKVVWFQPRGMI